MRNFITIVSCVILTISSFSCTNFLKNKNNNEWYKDKYYHWHIVNNKGVDEMHHIEHHMYNDWILDKIPTVETEGLKYRECNVCHYLEVEKISKRSANNVDNMIVPNNNYSFTQYETFITYMNNYYFKNNDNSFLIFEPIVDLKNVLSTTYSIHYEEEKNGVLSNPLIKEIFIINDYCIGSLFKENGNILKYQYTFECLFFPFKDKNLDKHKEFNKVNIVYINPNKIQLKCEDLFIINVNIPDYNNLSEIISFIKYSLKNIID